MPLQNLGIFHLNSGIYIYTYIYDVEKYLTSGISRCCVYRNEIALGDLETALNLGIINFASFTFCIRQSAGGLGAISKKSC